MTSSSKLQTQTVLETLQKLSSSPKQIYESICAMKPTLESDFDQYEEAEDYGLLPHFREVINLLDAVGEVLSTKLQAERLKNRAEAVEQAERAVCRPTFDELVVALESEGIAVRIGKREYKLISAE